MNEEKIQNNLLLVTYNHYYRMVMFVIEQDQTIMCNEASMLEQIGESWDGEYCPLCLYARRLTKSRYALCGECFITTRTTKCGYGTDNLWSRLCHSKTWGQWTIAASQIMYWLEANRP